MGTGGLFLEVPIGTLCCFMFLYFSFLSTSGTKFVRVMRLMLLAGILWSASDLFMRMQLYPGIHFWYSASIFGLLIIPTCTYYYVFQIMGVQKRWFLTIHAGISSFFSVFNACIDVLDGEPQVLRKTGDVSYSGSAYAITLLYAFEILFWIYVVVFTYRQTKGDTDMQKKLYPLLLSGICTLLGNMLETVTGNEFSFGCLSGVILAACLTYIIYRQYLFDVGKRFMLGVAYTIAAFLILIPIWHISRNFERVREVASLSMQGTFLLLAGGFILWTFGIIFAVAKLAGNLEQKQSEKRFEKLQQFQQETLLFLDVGELYQKIFKIVPVLIRNVDVVVAVHNEMTGDFEEASNTMEGICLKSREEAEREYTELSEQKQVEIAPIYYEDKFQGYLCLKPRGKLKMDYLEVGCFRQLVSYVSICLKNIYTYQRRYQLTIHDELTGLYNRRYFKEFVEKHWDRREKLAFAMLDVDNFKIFNELYGEECGDDILRWCGQVIQKVAGKEDMVFRLGSNEYVIFFRGKEKNELLQVIEKIQGYLQEETGDRPKVLQPITMSIGIALDGLHPQSSDELLKQAERALFFAKQNGKNCIEIYGEADKTEEDKNSQNSAYEQISSTVYALTAAINARDPYTFDHSAHVSQYAVLLAKELGLYSNEVRIVREAGLLHDIGKIGIPDHILQKHGKLTEEEYEIIKTHVTKSVEMIHFLPNMNYVIPAVLSHHERYDGKGYPRGLAGEEIPLLGRILAVCDCYDAMVSRRSYKAALSVEYAIEELKRNKGTQFDPDLVDIFITLIPHLKRGMEEADKAG